MSAFILVDRGGLEDYVPSSDLETETVLKAIRLLSPIDQSVCDQALQTLKP